MKRLPKSRLLRFVVLPLIAVVGLLLLYGCAAEVLVWNTDRITPRDPETGVMIGAEARTLGPEEAAGAVLFVHGHIGAGDNFADLPEKAAAAGWRVRVMRLAGHGTSPRDYARTTKGQLLDSVRAEAQALRDQGYGEVVLIGHSMGGALSTLAAAEGDVDRLVLAAPYFGVTHKWWYGLRPETWAKVLAPFVWWVPKIDFFVQVNRREAVDEITSYYWAPVRTLAMIPEIAAEASARETTARVDVPVLWLHAPGDNAADFDTARRTVEAFASDDVTSVTLPRSNHLIFHDFDRAMVEEAVLEFLGTP
ncbi:MAG: alpha/beta fold hydrolase [Sumerlaeia bacterium]